jgi:hypothetical protein
VPEQARHLGMDYPDLVEAILAEALKDAAAASGEEGGRLTMAQTIRRGGKGVRRGRRSAGPRPRCRRRASRPARPSAMSCACSRSARKRCTGSC